MLTVDQFNNIVEEYTIACAAYKDAFSKCFDRFDIDSNNRKWGSLDLDAARDTKDVILNDYNALTDVSSVDQYIKAFFISPSLDGQQTDIHYRYFFLYNLVFF